jgi:hypothetical protein
LAAYGSAAGTSVARLGVNGSVDAGFGTVDLPSSPAYSTMLVGNDGIYVAGTPATGNGVGIVRLTQAGSST